MTAMALDVSAVRLSRGTRTILDGMSFRVARGSLVALMGLSGSGKTTMLRTIAALERFEEGRIVVDGVTLAAGAQPPVATLRALRTRVGMVFQFHHLFEHLPVLQNVTLAPIYVHREQADAAAGRARQLLASLGVDHRAAALPRELSGGEAQRVAIARALAVDPPLLMMDEPTASLDPQRRSELGALLRGLAAQGRAVLISTHDVEFAEQFATATLRLVDGRIVG